MNIISLSLIAEFILGAMFGYTICKICNELLIISKNKKLWLKSLDDKSYRAYKEIFSGEKDV